ncbi:hypothetical protein MWU65_04260 [Cellulophaga sp. F20128]|uniref:hypothetical protein n=1 Tax=Cellulophaga sp. F20128 TaxID=2926413 RepID=UPI001FF671DA|nr:hypothetical protein [Cellulophaga sp. F20128]MCK0156379.1 hypothetical protein [Cellulophaga sp. F20128]
MDSKKYLDDISEIKNMMRKSSRFMSLSGLSGILAGVYALIGAYLAHNIISTIGKEPNEIRRFFTTLGQLDYLLIIALSVMALALITGTILTYFKAKRSGEKMWDISSKRLLLNFALPLVVGGLFCLVLIQYEYIKIVAPATLIFYGLACVNASKYTLGGVRYLGITIIAIGLISTQFIGYGLYFWALGFGVCHIIYGSLMYFKHDRH